MALAGVGGGGVCLRGLQQMLLVVSVEEFLEAPSMQELVVGSVPRGPEVPTPSLPHVVTGIARVIPPHRKETSRIKLPLKTEKTGLALIPPMGNVTLFFFLLSQDYTFCGFLMLILKGNSLLLEEVSSCYSSKELSLQLKQKKLRPFKLNLEGGALKIKIKIRAVWDISNLHS